MAPASEVSQRGSGRGRCTARRPTRHASTATRRRRNRPPRRAPAPRVRAPRSTRRRRVRTARPRPQRVHRDHRSPLPGGGCRRLHLDRRGLGCGRRDRLLDGELQRHRRRRAPSQLPSRRSRTTPSAVTSTSSTSPPCEPRYGRTLSSAASTRPPPRAGAVRARSAGWRPGRLRQSALSPVVEPTGLLEDPQHPLQPGAVEIGDQPDQLLGPLAGDGTAGRAGVQQRLDPIAGRAQVERLGSSGSWSCRGWITRR